MKPNTKSIYLVVAYGGQWEDSWEENIKAFNSLEKAEVFAMKATKDIPEYSEYIKRLEERVCGLAHYAGEKKDYPEYYAEYDRVYNALMDKVNKKYPNLTGNHDECDVTYRVEEVAWGG